MWCIGVSSRNAATRWRISDPYYAQRMSESSSPGASTPPSYHVTRTQLRCVATNPAEASSPVAPAHARRHAVIVRQSRGRERKTLRGRSRGPTTRRTSASGRSTVSTSVGWHVLKTTNATLLAKRSVDSNVLTTTASSLVLFRAPPVWNHACGNVSMRHARFSVARYVGILLLCRTPLTRL